MADRKPWQRTGPDTRIRGRKGQEIRAQRLARTHGLCERCTASERTELATVVDHIVPLARGGSDIDSNTRNLCDPCHAAVTAEQFGTTNRSARGVSDDGWPAAPTS